MRCENIFCIYNSDKKCTIDEISIDISGTCTECIYADIDEKLLTKAKAKLLKEYEQ